MYSRIRAGRIVLRAALLALLLGLGAQAALAVTVTRTPTSTANCTSSSAGGTRIWSNPSRAIADDNSNATASVDGTTTRYLQCLNYGFNLPSGAIINGITVRVSRRSNRTSNGGSRDAMMRLVRDGVIGSTDRATSTLYTTTEVAEAHGGAADLWGQTWTAADVNASNFGAAFAATKPQSAGSSHTISVDVISISIDYTDTTPPTVTSLVRASINPVSGSAAAWTVTFSESVTGVDTADFALAASGVTGATISSVSGSGTTWTVNASTGLGSGTLGLNLVDNDSIGDAAGNRLGGTGADNGNQTGEVYTVDKANPNVLTIARSGASPTNAASLSWIVTLSESVTGIDSTDFALVATGAASAAITSVTGSGTSYTVTATSVSGTGTIGLNLVDNDSIVDGSSNPLGGAGAGNGNATGQVYSVDRVAPTVVSITRGLANPSDANEVTWTVTFSESVSGVDSSDFALATSGLSGASITAVSGSGPTWTVAVDPGYGAGTVGLNLVDNDSIVDITVNPLGGMGNGNGNFTGPVYTVTTPALATWLMEEASWNGSVDQVSDAQGAANAGTSKNGATTAVLVPALSGSPGSCRYGLFHSAASPAITRGYIDLSGDFPYLTNSFTLVGWVRSSSVSTANQWIFTHNTGGTGYSLSLGNAGAGRLRFASGGASTVNLDSPSAAASLLANDTWYFVAAVADFAGDPSIVRRLFVFNSSGALLSGYPVSLSTTGWGDTEAGAASIGGDGSNSLRGMLDELQVFDKALNPAALSALAQQRRACTTAVPDHYEVALATSSLSCLATPVTVTACADATNPCSNPFTNAAGSTVTLATIGATLTATTLTLDGTGTATTSLSYPSATNGTAASVTLSAVSMAATAADRCCPNGTSCVASSSCSTNFNTAGFIVSASNGGAVATVPTQTAGTASAGYVLRAVRSSTTTQACEAAITGVGSVNWSATCNNPTTCSAGNRMTVTGNAAVAVAGNANGSSGSSTAVAMTFDANGNAPFSFNYADVGQITLNASRAAGGSLLTALSGSSNAFVVRPGGFAVSGIRQTAAPQLVNPAAASAAGSRFIKAGEAFSATVTAQTSGGATTPNYGRETAPEGVLLTRALVLPAAGAAGTLSNGSIAGGSFSSGVATVTNLAFSEVGIITLNPAVADSDYLGAGNVTGTASGNIGRFIPAQFALSSGSVTHRSALSCAPASAFSYLGENFRLGFTLTAQNTAGATTTNYSGAFARLDPTSATWNLAGRDASTVFTVASARLSLGSATGSFSNGVASGITLTANAARAASPDGPFSAIFGVAPVDSDGVAMAAFDTASAAGAGNDRTGVATVPLRFGRLRLGSAVGAADRMLALPVAAQHWTGSAFDTNTLDSCTAVATTAMNFGNLRGTLTTADTAASGAITLASGAGALRLAAPDGGRSGTYDVSLSLGSSATDASCLQSWMPGAGDVATVGANLAYLRGNFCASTYSNDPAARATFGRQRGVDNLIYRRENF